ncbi:MAG: hypothetical protein H7123_04195 [Thermoleophilia bacterium]|nr:hypothetical protein [Thermoleophilia bacterium]
MQVPRRSRRRLAADALTRKHSLAVLIVVLALTLITHQALIIAPLLYLVVTAGTYVATASKRIRPGSFAVRELVMALPPTLRTRVQNVIGMTDKIRVDLDGLAVEPAGVRDGLDSVIVAAIDTAKHVVKVNEYLHTVSVGTVTAQLERSREAAAVDASLASAVSAIEEQLGVVKRLTDRRDGLDRQLDKIAASLGIIHARVVQARVESDDVVDVAKELLGLRDTTTALVAGIEEVQAIGAKVPIAELD